MGNPWTVQVQDVAARVKVFNLYKYELDPVMDQISTRKACGSASRSVVRCHIDLHLFAACSPIYPLQFTIAGNLLAKRATKRVGTYTYCKPPLYSLGGWLGLRGSVQQTAGWGC